MNRRWIRRLVIIFAVLAVLLVGADRLSVHFADNYLADRAGQGLGFDRTPDTSIEGFPFLTQALSRRLDHVSMAMDDVTVDEPGGQAGNWLNLSRLTIDLHSVEINGGYSGGTADLVTGSIRISYADLSKAVTMRTRSGVTTLSAAPASASAGANGSAQVKVANTPNPGETRAPYAGLGDVTVGGRNTIALTVPGLATRAAEPDISWTVNLPAGIHLDQVHATPDGLAITLLGHQVDLRSMASASR